MRKIALGLALILAAAALRPQVSLAEECVTVYGGGVICGASTEHVPVDTAIADINPAVLGTGLLLISRGLRVISRKLKEETSLLG
jgi:uncharacterized membrane protein